MPVQESAGTVASAMPPLRHRIEGLGRPIATGLVLVVGLAAPLFLQSPGAGHWIWMGGLVALGAPIVWSTIRGALAGRFAADLVASLALVTAAVLNQPVPGLVIVLMQTGGEALERLAARRASRAVADLEGQAPRIAHRLEAGAVRDIDVSAIAVGDRLLVRPGEMIPCDGTVAEGRSALDTSRITGEPLPVAVELGATVRSGSLNLSGPLAITATARAAESLYHQIVELVRTAQESKAPVQRIADRAAVWFTPATLLACVIAFVLSGDPDRILAVLVVATPCPLILAAPVAMLGGISRAAGHQIIVRHGTALQQLSRVDVAVFDKTGTLTVGHPVVDGIEPMAPYSIPDFIRLAGGLEQGSGHPLAAPIVAAAMSHAGWLPHGTNVTEYPGRGIVGTVEGRRVVVGAITLVRELAPAAEAAFAMAAPGHGLRAYVTIDGAAAGSITFADQLKPSARAMVRGLAALGITRTILLSGDRSANAEEVRQALELDEARGDLLPQDKTDAVRALASSGATVLMVGDGANDAPALAAAAVGVAIASQGGGVSAEAADIVLLTDDLRRLPEAVAIARRTLRITRESIGAGLGLSLVAMVFAGAGYITPTVGALLQEAIDVAVILNALRVLQAGADELALHGGMDSHPPAAAALQAGGRFRAR